MKQIVIIVLFLLNICSESHGQHYLNIVSDHGGPTGQSMGYVCMADSHYIYTLGDFIDSSRTIKWPYFAVYDYDGVLAWQDTIKENDFREPFWMSKFKPVHKKGTHYYYIAKR